MNILGIAFWVVFLLLYPLFFLKKENGASVPDRKLKMASVAELVFAFMLFCFGLIAAPFMRSRFLFSAGIFFGLIWFVLAFHLQYGKPVARKVCFYLSILRLFTIIGIPFSLLAFFQLRKTEGTTTSSDSKGSSKG